ncbi:putative leader peptide [Streptomyces phaeochromogenes]
MRARTMARHSVQRAAPLHRVRLYSRQHIDLLRVAGALCCS